MERVYIYVVDLCVSCEVYVHGSSSEAETRVSRLWKVHVVAVMPLIVMSS